MSCKIIIAPDSFKGSISAKDAASAIERGLQLGWRGEEPLQTVCLPIADGGEGTLEVLTSPDERAERTVTGPNFAPVAAKYGCCGEVAVVEMASAAGLTLIPEEARSAKSTTTYGVGELIRHALDAGLREILLTVGGSATNDGGSGMLAALGAVFYNASGEAFLPTGGTLEQIARIELSGLDQRLQSCKITVATDVRNPLLGPDGATAVYAPQKGATPQELLQMERGMSHYAALLKALSGKDVASVAGCGAGGGLAAPLLAFANASLRSGIDAVLDAVRFSHHLKGATAVITGEGKLDRQSLFGKAISGVARAAAAASVPVYCFVGCVGDDPADLLAMGLSGITTLCDLVPTPQESILRAAELLQLCGEAFWRKWE